MIMSCWASRHAMRNAAEDSERVLNEAIDVACFFLQKSGEFFPFAVVMHPLGEIKHIEGYTGEEHPVAVSLVDLLAAALQEDADAGVISCAAIVSDVRLKSDGPTTDAISIHLEHVAEEPMRCYLPYSWQNAILETGELVGKSTKALVFTKQSAS